MHINHTAKNGQKKPARCVKEIGCSNEDTCPFKCMSKIGVVGRKEIHDSYWALNDSEKRHYYAANVKQVSCQRKRTKAELSRKSYSLIYNFNYMKADIRVCQQFFSTRLMSIREECTTFSTKVRIGQL